MNGLVTAGLEIHGGLKGLDASDTAEFLPTFDESSDAMNSSQEIVYKAVQMCCFGRIRAPGLFNQHLKWLEQLSVADENAKDVTYIIKCLNTKWLTLSYTVCCDSDVDCVTSVSLAFGRLFKQICCQSLLSTVLGANCIFDFKALCRCQVF